MIIAYRQDSAQLVLQGEITGRLLQIRLDLIHLSDRVVVFILLLFNLHIGAFNGHHGVEQVFDKEGLLNVDRV